MTEETKPRRIVRRVVLLEDEFITAALVGFFRQIRNSLAGLKTSKTHEVTAEIAFDLHIYGAVSEYVVSRWMNTAWLSAFRFGDIDVAGVQVKTTIYPNGGLLLKEKDSEDDIFLLVTGKNLEWFIRGWIYGAEGKQERFMDKTLPRPCFRVPQENLRCITTLQEAIKRKRAKAEPLPPTG